jgi:hypothetical protein
MSVCYLPPCPTTCEGSVAEVSFNECAPEKHWGEISKLYVVDANFGGLDADNLADWNANLDDVTDKMIRTLIVIGELPEPETVEVPLSGDRIAIGSKTFNLNFIIDETNETNYAFLKTVECGGKFIIWFETSDGILYGDDTGIEVSLRINMVIPRERTAVVTYVGKATWKSLTHPCRTIFPLA